MHTDCPKSEGELVQCELKLLQKGVPLTQPLMCIFSVVKRVGRKGKHVPTSMTRVPLWTASVSNILIASLLSTRNFNRFSANIQRARGSKIE